MSNNYEPELHSCGQSSPYIDPDYGALLSTDQLPSLSTIGRGPRGFGLFANANETTDGYFTFDIVSDVTGESILTSPNLHSGVISVKQRPDDLVPGASSFLDITVTRGQDVATYEVELPPGADGGRVYLWDGTKEKHPSWTYRIPTDELHFDGEAVWPSKPDPRPNDIVMMTIKDTHKYYLAVAHVVGNVGLDTIVTATTFCPVPVPYIGDNGHWYVDGEDTGFEAQGPKGDKAQMRIGTVTTLVPGKQAEASIALVDEEDNIYELSLKIPEGNLGRSVDIQPGVYTEATLPAFHLTPINTAYIVDDSDGRFDLYIRAHEAAGDAQWTILENWEGKPATIGDVTVVHLKQNEEAYAEVSWSTTPEANRYDIKLFLPLDLVPGSITTELIADGAITYDKIDQQLKDGVDYRYELPLADDDTLGGVYAPKLPADANELTPYSIFMNEAINAVDDPGRLMIGGRTVKNVQVQYSNPPAPESNDPDRYKLSFSNAGEALIGKDGALDTDTVFRAVFDQANSATTIEVTFLAEGATPVTYSVVRPVTNGGFSSVWEPNEIKEYSYHLLTPAVDGTETLMVVVDMPLPYGGKDFANIIDGEMVEIASKTKTGVVRTKEGGDINIDVQGVMSLAEGSVHTEHLAGGAVTTEKIADKEVTLSKLGDDVLARIDINDDVLEFANLAAFPATGETGKIYIATDTNKMYRWSGAGYAEISSSLALGTTSATAFRGDHGQIAYTHSQAQGNPHNLKASDIIKAGTNIQLATDGTVSATGCANALIGTESGEVVYVEDAWPANAVRVVISGKSVQDGTPTPGTPVPIINVASPVQIMISDDISE